MILAQYDDQSVIVYQAYRESIASWAIAHQRFGGEFQLTRMSWIKPGFLWMMYRSGWARKQGQERVLAVRIRRDAFDWTLGAAVVSSYDAERYASKSEWQEAVRRSEVRLQWDPDHDPAGHPLERRALQLGLRRTALERYAGEWLLGIEDVTERVAAERVHADGGDWDELCTPHEDVYPAGGVGLHPRVRE